MLQLKELRAKTNSTQLDLATYLGISRPTYTRYETGEREPNISTLINLAEFFGVSVDSLLGAHTNSTKIIDEITERISNLSDDDKQGLLRYLDFIEKRNNT